MNMKRSLQIICQQVCLFSPFFFFSLFLPFFITHIIPMAIVYFWVGLLCGGSFLGYLKLRRMYLDRKHGGHVPNKFVTCVDKYLIGQNVKFIRKFLFQLIITIVVQMLYNYGVLLYTGNSYTQVIHIDFWSRTLKRWASGINLSMHRKL